MIITAAETKRIYVARTNNGTDSKRCEQCKKQLNACTCKARAVRKSRVNLYCLDKELYSMPPYKNWITQTRKKITKRKFYQLRFSHNVH